MPLMVPFMLSLLMPQMQSFSRMAMATVTALLAVILVDQIKRDQASGSHPAVAIADAVVRRTRSILLTAAAILALVPLGLSVFWGRLPISIIDALVSATVLTLFFVPVLYAAWTRVPRHGATLPLAWKQQTIHG